VDALEWDKAFEGGSEICGGKGYHLGWLRRYGFRLPHGGSAVRTDHAGGWDHHAKPTESLKKSVGSTDPPIAGLLKDLKQRGCSIPPWWCGAASFGRLPAVERQGDGRDHNPRGFTTWMAGGVIKGGSICGATDELGCAAVETPRRIAICMRPFCTFWEWTFGN